MNDLSDFIDRLLNKLSEAGIPTMLVGSVAANYHGHPRSTFNVDVVVDADEETLCRFARSLGENYYVSEEAVREAVRSRRAFNIIDQATGYKADIVIRKERPFSRMELARRMSVSMLGRTMEIATPEDVILSKLEWSKLGSCERQWADALQVAKTQGGRLDVAYIEKWARELGVSRLWDRVRQAVFPDDQGDTSEDVQ